MTSHQHWLIDTHGGVEGGARGGARLARSVSQPATVCVIACGVDAMIATTGCSVDATPVADVASAREALVGGANDLASDPRDQRRRDAVGQLFVAGGSCTATALTPRAAVTAYHCIDHGLPAVVRFGAKTVGTDALAPTSLSVGTVLCDAHPDALFGFMGIDGEDIIARCGDGNSEYVDKGMISPSSS